MVHSPPPLLLLWDIDGTLLASGGSGMRALTSALQTVFGIDGSLADIDFAGRTDRWIMRAVFTKFGLPATDENFARYFEGYVTALPLELLKPGSGVLPGVRAVLADAASRPYVTQALLTGNMRRGAQVKLGHHQLWEYFPFGAFADDTELRNDLGPFALRRATEWRGITFEPTRVWVIGDTPHDIACGRAIGARTLAVATGHCPAETLRANHPDVFLADLSDTVGFWTQIEGAATDPSLTMSGREQPRLAR